MSGIVREMIAVSGARTYTVSGYGMKWRLTVQRDAAGRVRGTLRGSHPRGAGGVVRTLGPVTCYRVICGMTYLGAPTSVNARRIMTGGPVLLASPSSK